MKKNAASKNAKRLTPNLRSGGTQGDAKPSVVALTPLNFKVSEEFHREFKTFAAQHSKKMVELLQDAFALIKEANGR